MTADSSISTKQPDENTCKAFVKEDGQATLTCPSCRSVKVVSAGQYRERQHRLKVRCACSCVFRVSLDFRQCFRKDTNISGIFFLYPPAIGGGMIQVCNLSLDGVCFEVKGKHHIQIGQTGNIDFTLDNRKRTQLKRDFTVRSVSNHMIGCEFKKDQAFEKELGFYLRFGP